MQTAAALGTNLGAEDSSDFSLASAQKIASAMTVSTARQGTESWIAKGIDRVTKHVSGKDKPTTLLFKLPWDPGQDEGNFMCKNTDG